VCTRATVETSPVRDATAVPVGSTACFPRTDDQKDRGSHGNAFDTKWVTAHVIGDANAGFGG
jgi:hypothetical protein